jgi:hypothetical protein
MVALKLLLGRVCKPCQHEAHWGMKVTSIAVAACLLDVAAADAQGCAALPEQAAGADTA